MADEEKKLSDHHREAFELLEKNLKNAQENVQAKKRNLKIISVLLYSLIVILLIFLSFFIYWYSQS